MGLSMTKIFPLSVDKTIDKLVLAAQARKTKYYAALFSPKDAPEGDTYTEATMAGVPVARTIKEGGRFDVVTPEMGNKVNRTYLKAGLSVQLTIEQAQDDIKGGFKKIPEMLVDSIYEKIETDAAAVLTSGFTTASAGQDGKALFANNHTTLVGGATINNLGTGDLSSTTLQAAFEYGAKLKNDTGFIKPVRPKILTMHTDGMWVANDLLKATGRVWDYADTQNYQMDLNKGRVNSAATSATAGFPAANANNLLNPKNGVVDDWRIFLNPYYIDTDAWFVLFEGFDLSLLWKIKPALETDTDTNTRNRIYTMLARYSMFSNAYQFMYGSAGA